MGIPIWLISLHFAASAGKVVICNDVSDTVGIIVICMIAPVPRIKEAVQI